MKSKVNQAYTLLSKGKLAEAIRLFNQLYFEYPQDLDIQMGRVFCDIGASELSKGVALSEFYYLLRQEKSSLQAKEEILPRLHKLEEAENSETEKALELALGSAEALSCISFEDFKTFVFSKNTFKEAFEDFTLSTKIVFSSKNELYEFLNLLIDEGYANLSLQYAENIGENMGFDTQIHQILQKAVKHLNEN